MLQKLKLNPLPVKQKKCKACHGSFTPFNTIVKMCIPCAIKSVRVSEKKKFKKSARKELRVYKDNDVKHQRKITQTVFNRLRVLQEKKWFHDRGLEPTCISCGKSNMDWCCGHFKTVGAQPELRYDDKNTFLQCNRYCNLGLSGNISGTKTTRGYVAGLFERFGDDAKEIIDYCETYTERNKWTAQELIEMRKNMNIEIRELKSAEATY